MKIKTIVKVLLFSLLPQTGPRYREKMYGCTCFSRYMCTVHVRGISEDGNLRAGAGMVRCYCAE